jgi:hypothetical protein
MTAAFKIEQLERNASDDGVVVAHWRASDVDGDHSGSSYGTCSFTPDPTDEAFIFFEDLTEADVLSWVESELDVDAIEASIAAQIAESKQPAVSVGVPW